MSWQASILTRVVCLCADTSPNRCVPPAIRIATLLERHDRRSGLFALIDFMKLSKLILLFGILLLPGVVANGQFFNLPGRFGYSLNSAKQVFDISPDGKIGIALQNDPAATHPAC